MTISIPTALRSNSLSFPSDRQEINRDDSGGVDLRGNDEEGDRGGERGEDGDAGLHDGELLLRFVYFSADSLLLVLTDTTICHLIYYLYSFLIFDLFLYLSHRYYATAAHLHPPSSFFHFFFHPHSHLSLLSDFIFFTSEDDDVSDDTEVRTCALHGSWIQILEVSDFYIFCSSILLLPSQLPTITLFFLFLLPFFYSIPFYSTIYTSLLFFTSTRLNSTQLNHLFLPFVAPLRFLFLISLCQ